MNGGIGYVLVGSTGTGKSSLTNLFSKSAAHVSHGAKAGTPLTRMYQHKNGKDIFIDTVGAEDPNGKSDKQIMIETLTFLQRNNVKNIVVIWTIKPDVRESATLQNQAEYINSFKNGDIWKSTILIVKGSKKFRLKIDSEGAMVASNKYNTSNIEILKITFDCIDWWTNELKQAFMQDFGDLTKDELLQQGYYYNNDVTNLVNNTINKLPKSSCKVMFEDAKCIKCGVIGDKRCMPEKCHFEMELQHIGTLNKTREHTGQLHEKTIGYNTYFEHYGSLYEASYTYFLAWNWDYKYKYDCCGQMKGSQGCRRQSIPITEQVMSCCDLSQDKQCLHAKDIWSCCNKDADSDGCTKRCKKCNGLWNDSSYKGCSIGNHQTIDN